MPQLLPPVVILAAGQGHRLLERSGGMPKPLTPVLGVPLLERTVRSCQAAGLTEGLVVVGYRHEVLQAEVDRLAERYAMTLQVVHNPVWQEGNGTSALAVAPYLARPFVLMMCDHVFTPTMLQPLLAAEDDTDICRLAVDRRTTSIFDLPDATKVCLDGQRITAIGKDLRIFDAIDTGFFLCRPRLFQALEHARAQGDSSLSGGMRRLIQQEALQAVDIGTHWWSDVDTPASLVYTERMLQAGLDTAPAPVAHAEAIAYLRAADPIMQQIIAHCGPCTLQPHGLEPFVMLCRSIIYQQLSGKAAGTIMARFLELYAPAFPTPQGVLQSSEDTLRSIGLSRQKLAYLYDLATKVHQGTLQLNTLPSQGDADVIAYLTQVKGIGRWTAEMFLMFALGRLDVFPVDDLGIRKAIQRAYGYKSLPAPVTMQRHARKWTPYRSIATWYLWRSLDVTALPFQETPAPEA
jgi:3-methyladenine DNA glycosylase/8-oxoguanine DNA glycosylase/choline kinase